MLNYYFFIFLATLDFVLAVLFCDRPLVRLSWVVSCWPLLLFFGFEASRCWLWSLCVYAWKDQHLSSFIKNWGFPGGWRYGSYGLWLLLLLDLDIYKVCTYYFVFSVWFFEWLCEEIVTIGSRDILKLFCRIDFRFWNMYIILFTYLKVVIVANPKYSVCCPNVFHSLFCSSLGVSW